MNIKRKKKKKNKNINKNYLLFKEIMNNYNS